MARALKTVVGVLVALAVAGIALWWFAIRSDPPPEAALPARDTPSSSTGPGASPDGTWTIATGDDVFVGYRVTEVLAAVRQETAGRTTDVRGTLTISGSTIESAEVVADVTRLESDRERRDNRLRTDGLQTDTFPEASFVLTEPIELADVPVVGVAVQIRAVGDLTLHGVTRAVDIALDARWNGDAIDVAGSLPVVFADYDIDPPNIGGFVEVDDTGTLELQLSFRRS